MIDVGSANNNPLRYRMSSREKPLMGNLHGQTIAGVAAAAGVSAMTVSRFFSHPEMLSPTMYERVKLTVEALNFIPNATARALMRGSTETLALVLADMRHPFFMEVAAGVEEAAQQAGYTLLLGNSREDLMKERRYLEGFISRRVEGVIVAPTYGAQHNLDVLGSQGVPTLLIDRRLPGYAFDVVRGDTFLGGYILTKHLVDQGYRNITFVGGYLGTSSLVDRLNGYRKAIEEANLVERSIAGRYDQESGFEIIDQLVQGDERFPDALITANNMVAVGALLALRKHNLEVPDDVALATFDDFEIASLLDPFLTVVKQPAFEIGVKATAMLLERINNPQRPIKELVLPVELIVRRSTKSSGF